jgi:hypothetical protein
VLLRKPLRFYVSRALDTALGKSAVETKFPASTFQDLRQLHPPQTSHRGSSREHIAALAIARCSLDRKCGMQDDLPLLTLARVRPMPLYNQGSIEPVQIPTIFLSFPLPASPSLYSALAQVS